MAKTKTVFFCRNCGNESPKWVGKCPACGEWNSYVEETVVTGKAGKQSATNRISGPASKPIAIQDIPAGKEQRIDLQNAEMNRVLGGGLVPGSLVLVGGEPGIGKSTLMLQIALAIPDMRVLYISGRKASSR